VKDRDVIEDRVQKLIDTERDSRLVESTRRLPHRCVYNHRQALDIRKTSLGEPNQDYNNVSRTRQTIGLCMYGSEDAETWLGNICEDPIDAQRCPLFVPQHERQVILDQFYQDLQEPLWVSSNMPELAALLWVLDQHALPKMNWFSRVVNSLRRYRLEALQPHVDPARLLPGDP